MLAQRLGLIKQVCSSSITIELGDEEYFFEKHLNHELAEKAFNNRIEQLSHPCMGCILNYITENLSDTSDALNNELPLLAAFLGMILHAETNLEDYLRKNSVVFNLDMLNHFLEIESETRQESKAEDDNMPTHKEPSKSNLH